MKPTVLVLAFALSLCSLAGSFALGQTQETKPDLRVLAEPFIFQGGYYLKLSLYNQSKEPLTLASSRPLMPDWTPFKIFDVITDGEKLARTTLGAFSLGRPSDAKREIQPNSSLFFGVALLAGKAKGIDTSNAARFDVGGKELAAGNHEIEVQAKNAASAKFKVTIPDKIESAADWNIPKSETPLRFSVAADSGTAGFFLHIYVANETTDLWHYPYRGDTQPWLRSDWYQLEVDGKHLNALRIPDEKDGKGKREIPRMHQWYAQTLTIIADKAQLTKSTEHPVYIIPSGDHTVRVIPSPLWGEQKLPVPGAGSIRIRVAPSKD